MIKHEDELILFRLLKALRKAFRADTNLLKNINTYLRVQCVLCGSMYKTREDRDRHQAVCIVRFLTLSYYYGQTMTTLEPLQGLYAKEKIRELEQSHALQQMTALGEKIMEGQVLPSHKVANLTGAFDDDNTEDGDNESAGTGVHGERRKEIITSFQRIMRDETDLDLMFRSDHDDPSSKAYKNKNLPSGSGVVDSVLIDDAGSEEMTDYADNEDDDDERPPKRSKMVAFTEEPAIHEIEMEEAVIEEDPQELLPTQMEMSEKGKGKGKGRNVRRESDDDNNDEGPSNQSKQRKKREENKGDGSRKKLTRKDKIPTPIDYLDKIDESADEQGDPESTMFPRRRRVRTKKRDKASKKYQKTKELIRIQMRQLAALSKSLITSDETSDSNEENDEDDGDDNGSR